MMACTRVKMAVVAPMPIGQRQYGRQGEGGRQAHLPQSVPNVL